MYSKGKGSSVPSDAQARERLALYVYEYLLHTGASKAAQTFLSEIRWDKNITLGEPPGFLSSWWCVFWDLYCAAPERRDNCEHSSEAKTFHDYGFVNPTNYNPGGVNGIGHNTGPSPGPMGPMPPNDSIPPGPGMPPNFFNNSNMRPSPTHPVSQSSPHPPPNAPHNQMMNQPFMGGPRYPGGPRPGVRMPPHMPNDFNSPNQPIMNNMDIMRPGPPVMNPRMNLSRGGYGPPMRGMPPGNVMGPGPGPGMHPGMGMGPVGRPQWTPGNPNHPMGGYTSSSPGNYPQGPPGPGTPLMTSPQDSNSGGENMYTMMKSVPGGSMPGEFSMGNPDSAGPLGPMGPNSMGPVMNGDGIEGIKRSPPDGPSTPRDDSGSGMGDYNLGGYGGPVDNDQNESAAILKIKESMQEEAKRFEKDSDHPEYYIP